jgi:hypothetical protein
MTTYVPNIFTLASVSMNETEFWKLISFVNVVVLDEGDEDAAVKPLQQELMRKSESELFEFEEQLSQQLFAIDGEIFAKNAGESGGSDDGFLYARCYVIAKGKEFYEAVKTDPTKMPQSIHQWCEALLYSHREVWAKLMKSDPSEWPFSASVSYETASNPDLWSD